MTKNISQIFLYLQCCRRENWQFFRYAEKIFLRSSILMTCHKFILTCLKSTSEKQEKGKKKKKHFNCCKLAKSFHLLVKVKFCLSYELLIYQFKTIAWFILQKGTNTDAAVIPNQQLHLCKWILNLPEISSLNQYTMSRGIL